MILTHRKFRQLAALGAALLLIGGAKADEVTFNRDVRPILSENCFFCHGPDPEHRDGELRLDLREEAIAPRKNGSAIVPGDAEKALFSIASPPAHRMISCRRKKLTCLPSSPLKSRP